MVNPTSHFVQCPCSIQTLYCYNMSPSHHIIRFFYYVTRSVLVLNGKTTVESQDYWFMRACHWPQIYHVFLVFSFQAEFAQNKNNIDLPSYEFMTNTGPFLWRGGGVGDEKNAPCLCPALYQTVTCSWNVDEWIRKLYRDCYVIRTFTKG